MEAKQSKINTVLTLALIGASTIAWGLGMHSLFSIEDGQKALRLEMMPRHEIEMQMMDMKTRITEIEAEMMRVRLDIAKRP